MSSIPKIDFKKWIEEHREHLKPPVANKMIWNEDDFIVMVIGGPNIRNDFHINQSEEFFYQVEGDINLHIRKKDGEFEDILIKEGEMLLLPGGVPHSPRRPAGTIGLVIEKKRAEDEIDSLVWYCKSCNALLGKGSFHLTNIEVQIKEAIENFYADESNYTCKKCGTVNPK